jgi:hypothetical protein
MNPRTKDRKNVIEDFLLRPGILLVTWAVASQIILKTRSQVVVRFLGLVRGPFWPLFRQLAAERMHSHR